MAGQFCFEINWPLALPKSIGKTNVPVIFLYIGQIFDKDNLKAKNNAIFVLEHEFLDLRKTILSNSKITLWATSLLIEKFKSSKSKPIWVNLNQESC